MPVQIMLHDLPITVIRSNRKTLAVQVTEEGEAILRCPHKLPEKALREAAAKYEDWYRKKLHIVRTRREACVRDAEAAQIDVQQLARQACEVIPARLAYFAGKIGVQYGRVTIRCQKTRWGSCSSRGNLNFNCALMLLPQEIIDYVVVHELCHRRQMNHSSEFWTEVERVLPDYRQRRDWLRKNGTRYLDMVRLQLGALQPLA